MIMFKNRFVTIVVNFFLLIWQLPQLITALIGLIIFHNCTWYENADAGVRVLRVNKGSFLGNTCFSSGPVIFVSSLCGENTLRHETGHSKQSIIFGPLFHIIVSIPSIILFWIRRLGNKSQKWYLSHWPENSAEALGHTKRQYL